MRRVLFSVLSVLFVGSILLLLLFFRNPAEGSIAFEAAQALLQVGVVAVLGTVVSLLVFEYQRERQAHDKDKELAHQQAEKERERYRKNLEYREALLLTTLSKAMDAYGQVKKARRLLRARAVITQGPAAVVLAEPYDRYFDLINDAQLDLENLARDAETSKKAFSNWEAVRDNLRAMDKYLSGLIDEYEDKRSLFSGNDPCLPLSDLPELSDFLVQNKSSQFRTQVVHTYHNVQKFIREDLLYPNLPEPIENTN